MGGRPDRDRLADGRARHFVVSTSLNAIRLDLGASIEDLEWTVNAYNLSFAVLLIPAAGLGDRYGRRRPLCGRAGPFFALCGLRARA